MINSHGDQFFTRREQSLLQTEAQGRIFGAKCLPETITSGKISPFQDGSDMISQYQINDLVAFPLESCH